MLHGTIPSGAAWHGPNSVRDQIFSRARLSMTAVAMILVGGFNEMIMGWSMISIALLIRFIIDSYNQIISGHVITPSASVGIAVQALGGNDLEQLLKAADSALCQMKRLDKCADQRANPCLRNIA